MEMQGENIARAIWQKEATIKRELEEITQRHMRQVEAACRGRETMTRRMKKTLHNYLRKLKVRQEKEVESAKAVLYGDLSSESTKAVTDLYRINRRLLQRCISINCSGCGSLCSFMVCNSFPVCGNCHTSLLKFSC